MLCSNRVYRNSRVQSLIAAQYSSTTRRNGAHHPAHETSIHHIRSFHVVPSARFGKIELITSAHVVRSLSLGTSCPGRCSIQRRWCAVHFDAVRNVPRCLSHYHATALPVGSNSHGYLHMVIDLGGVNSKPVGLPAVNEPKSKRPAH